MNIPEFLWGLFTLQCDYNIIVVLCHVSNYALRIYLISIN